MAFRPMAEDPAHGFRGFLRSRLGFVVLILIATGAVFASFAYVSPIVAIPVLLIAGLGLPVYVGQKRGRNLAILGLVVIVAVAPLATVVFTEQVLTSPSGEYSSGGVAPYESGGSVLQNASLAPFHGGSSTLFSWSVRIDPQFLASSLNHTNWSHDGLELFVSTCPGAIDLNSSYCSGGYLLFTHWNCFEADPADCANGTGNATPAPSPGTPFWFNSTVGYTGIWSWQMALVLNATNGTNLTEIFLAGDPNDNNGIEGPIVGDFGTVYELLIEEIFLVTLLYLGVVFYFVLALYVWYKGRERRRNEAVKRLAQQLPPATGGSGPPGAPVAGPSGPAGGPAPPTGSAAPAAGPGPEEVTCPNCSAVVYAGESKCWKCGSALGGSSTGAPLKSGPRAPES